LVKIQARRDLRVAQHPLQLHPHATGGEPQQAAGLQRMLQWQAGRIAEHQQVQHNVGVDHYDTRRSTVMNYSPQRLRRIIPSPRLLTSSGLGVLIFLVLWPSIGTARPADRL